MTKPSSKEWKRADGKALAARFFRTLQTAAEGTVKFLEAQLVEIGCVPNPLDGHVVNIAVLGISPIFKPNFNSTCNACVKQGCGRPERRTVNIRRSVERPICLEEVTSEGQAQKICSQTPKRERTFQQHRNVWKHPA